MSPKKDPLNTPIHQKPPPLVRISGTHREMGRQFGEAAKKQIEHSVENVRISVADGLRGSRVDVGRRAKFRRGNSSRLLRRNIRNTLKR